MKLPWRKNSEPKIDNGLPPEMQQFYDAKRKERTSVAWVLAFITLVVTVVLAFGSFFAGRWVYRKIAGSNQPAITTTLPEDEPSQSGDKPTKPAKTTKTSKPKKQTQPNTPTPTTPNTGPLPNTGPHGND